MTSPRRPCTDRDSLGVSASFWDRADADRVLTDEERQILDRSATDRHKLCEEVVLCKKMLQLLDMAVRRREAAIAAGKGTAKDLCGYDNRLDTVGVVHQFSVFLSSPEGEAIFTNGQLGPPTGPPSDDATAASSNSIDDPYTAGMCTRKKCKPHAGWPSLFAKHVKYTVRILASQANEKLINESRIRDSAASRFMRKQHENPHSVIVFDSDDDNSGSE